MCQELFHVLEITEEVDESPFPHEVNSLLKGQGRQTINTDKFYRVLNTNMINVKDKVQEAKIDVTISGTILERL